MRERAVQWSACWVALRSHGNVQRQCHGLQSARSFLCHRGWEAHEEAACVEAVRVPSAYPSRRVAGPAARGAFSEGAEPSSFRKAGVLELGSSKAPFRSPRRTAGITEGFDLPTVYLAGKSTASRRDCSPIHCLRKSSNSCLFVFLGPLRQVRGGSWQVPRNERCALVSNFQRLEAMPGIHPVPGFRSPLSVAGLVGKWTREPGKRMP